MNLTAQNWRDAQRCLNDVVRRPGGSAAAFLVHYWGAAPGLLSNKPHRHSFYELCYCTEGEGAYHESGRQLPIRAGTMFCSRPGIEHQITVPGEPKLYLLYAAFQLEDEASCPAAVTDAFGLLASEPEPLLLHGTEESAAAHLWLALLREAAGGLPLLPEALQAAAYALLASVPALFAAERPRSPLAYAADAGALSHGGRKRPSRLVQQALLYIGDNLGSPLKVPDIADYLHVSVRHLSRLCQVELGASIGDCIRRERLRLASELLAAGAAVKEAAARSGFGTVHYFTRVFTREMGMTPAVYRKRGQARSLR